MEKELTEKKNDLITRAEEVLNKAKEDCRELTEDEAMALAEIRDDIKKIKETLELKGFFDKEGGNKPMEEPKEKVEIEYKGQKYSLVFNLNVMEVIQEEYGTIGKWGELTDGTNGEVNAKAVIFGLTEMLNEGLDIYNEENGTNLKPFTKKQVGRILTEIGLQEATKKLNDTVVESTKSDEKN